MPSHSVGVGWGGRLFLAAGGREQNRLGESDEPVEQRTVALEDEAMQRRRVVELEGPSEVDPGTVVPTGPGQDQHLRVGVVGGPPHLGLQRLEHFVRPTVEAVWIVHGQGRHPVHGLAEDQVLGHGREGTA